jgi:predicted TIM-barrel fold metal-dependent hydrolase
VAKEHRNVWIDLADADPPEIQAMVDGAPAERIIFGSDDPYGKLEVQLARTLDAIGSRERLREMILGENMARLLRLT